MANTNALKYQAAYVQSNTERYEKFREEAYKEFVEARGDQAAYLKLLGDQAKALEDAIVDEKKTAAAAAKGMSELEWAKQRQSLVDARTRASEDGAKRKIDIENQLKGELATSPAVQSKISDVSTYLATSAPLIRNSNDALAAVLGQVNEVGKSISPGSRSSITAAQDLLNAIVSSPVWGSLDQNARDQVENNIVNVSGIESVQLGGVSGRALIDAPAAALLQGEVNQKLKAYGGAYGVSDYNKMIADWDTKHASLVSGKATTENATEKPKTPNEIALKAIQDKIAGYKIPEFPSEAAVRARAQEKFAPEASPFLRDQFVRDVYLRDADQSKVVHYDAIVAAKKMKKLDENSDAYNAAKKFVDANPSKSYSSKADMRQKVLAKAAEYAGGDMSKRDAFLANYHAIEMGKHTAMFGPSDNAEASYIPAGGGKKETAESAVSPDHMAAPFQKMKELAAAPDVTATNVPPATATYGEETPAERAARDAQYRQNMRQQTEQNIARRLVAAGQALTSPSPQLTMEDLFKQQF
jgi:hypothetical protein